MKKILGFLLVTCSGVLLAEAYAATREATPPMPLTRMAGQSDKFCIPLVEMVNLVVNFNVRADSFVKAKVEFDKKIAQIDSIAKQHNIKEFEWRSGNYNYGVQQNEFTDNLPVTIYHLNVNYPMDSLDKALRLADSLTREKFQVGVNINPIKNTSCKKTIPESE